MDSTNDHCSDEARFAIMPFRFVRVLRIDPKGTGCVTFPDTLVSLFPSARCSDMVDDRCAFGIVTLFRLLGACDTPVEKMYACSES